MDWLEEIDDDLLEKVKNYIGNGDFDKYEDTYKGLDIFRYNTVYGKNIITVITHESSPKDWVEFDGDDIEKVYDWIDVYKDKGEEAADDFYFNFLYPDDPADIPAKYLEESEEKEIKTLTDFINSGYFHTVVVNDARTFNIHDWERDIWLDDPEEDHSKPLEEDNGDLPNEKFVLSENDVQAIIDKIASSDVYVGDYFKTKGFRKAHDLSPNDIVDIAKQLNKGDYSYSVKSNSFKLGDTISIFITKKDFKLKEKDLTGLTLYIEIDIDFGDPVAVVSIHDEYKTSKKYPKNNPYKEEKKEENKMNLKEYLESLDDKVEDTLDEEKIVDVFDVSYTIGDGPYQSIMVKADDPEEAAMKVKKQIKGADIVGVAAQLDPKGMMERGKPILEEITDDVSVRDWYINAFPNDELGYEIDDYIKFEDIQKALDDGEPDVYDVIGVADSIIRERLFSKLADLTGVSYDDIYEKWINSEETNSEQTVSFRNDDIYAFDD